MASPVLTFTRLSVRGLTVSSTGGGGGGAIMKPPYRAARTCGCSVGLPGLGTDRATDALCTGDAVWTGEALAAVLDFDSLVLLEWAAFVAVEAERPGWAKATSANGTAANVREAAKLNTKLRIASPFCCICATVSIPETRYWLKAKFSTWRGALEQQSYPLI